ncbi:response regulator [Cystobacter fuscus]|uniref:ATP-binding protein n=1 Tax=Cystobacter fuscus TaxID=43 RepID=UPI002B318505|nr:response regulator [Cystobacter fuscus]
MPALRRGGDDGQLTLGRATLLRALVELEQGNPEGCVALGAVRDEAQALVDFEFIFSNDADVLKRVCPGLVVGRRLSEAAPEALRSQFALLRQVVETRRAARSELHEADCWLRGTITPLLDGVLVRFQDVTALVRDAREHEARLEQEQSGRREAEALAREQAGRLVVAQEKLVRSGGLMVAGQLATGVGHEINNPLAFVTGNLHVALEQLGALARELPPSSAERLRETTRALEDARKGAERIRAVVRELRTLARESDARTEPVDVGAALELSLSMAMPHIRHRAQVVRHVVPVPRVPGNESKLGQVILNLLINAAQAIPEGDATRHAITVGTRMEGPQVVIEVRDTGKGMSAEVLARIFEPFFTTKLPGEGTGLGLPISLDIIRSMGGELKVQSEPGRGSSFQLVLPVIDEGSAPERAPPVMKPQAPSRRRVLIVDDEPAIGTMMVRVLGRHHEVKVVHSGREALELLCGDSRYDWVFCDLMMGDMTGMDLHAALARRRPEYLPRVIFMTGGAFTDRARAFLAEASVESIDKPFEAGALRERVERPLPGEREQHSR